MAESSFLKSILQTQILPLVEDLEERVLVLEVEQTPPALFALFLPFHQIMGIGKFTEQSVLQHLPEQILCLLKNIQEKRMDISSELVDALLSLVQGWSAMLNEFQEFVATQEEGSEISEWTSPLMKDLDASVQKLRGTEHEPEETSKSVPLSAETPVHFEVEWPPGLRSDFMTESQEGLFAIEDILLTLEEDPDKVELYNELFRTLHTLKGNAGVMLAMIPDESIRQTHSLTPFRDLSHRLESLVATHRDEQKPFTADGIDLLIKTIDMLKNLLVSIAQDDSSVINLHPLFLALKQYSSSTEVVKAIETSVTSVPAASEASAETLAFLNIAGQSLEMISGLMPKLSTEKERPAALKKYRRAVKTLNKTAQGFSNKPIKKGSLLLFENLALWKSSDAKELQKLLQSTQECLGHLNHEFSELEGHTKAPVSPAKVEAPRTEAAPAPAPAKTESTFLRVPHERVDRLMNLIGELVISKNGFEPLILELTRKYQLQGMAQKVKQTGKGIGRIASALQSEIMEIRMVPVSTVFSRFTRLLRDLSKTTGKVLHLEVQGENTLLDKSVLEQINDPLMHLIRNSADHGIETPEERKQAGKSETGTLTLSAEQKGHRVLLKVRDDGAGLDREKIAFKAASMGLVAAEDLEEMGDDAIYALIFHPGFSTAAQVTQVSGRGVGMDVVNSTVKKLRGSIEIESTQGQGSCITLSLPLSLAVSRGLMIESGTERFILPLDAIQELLKIPASKVHHFKETQRMIEIRAKVLSILSLKMLLEGNDIFSEKPSEGGLSQKQDPERIISLVVISVGEQSFALEVDRFLHEVEIMVKPMQDTLGKIHGIVGTTILSDGNVLLILNPMELIGG